MLWLVSAIVERLRRFAVALVALPAQAARALNEGGNEKRRLVIALLVACPAALVAGLIIPKLTLVMSPSIEAWVVVDSPGPIARGEYVRFTLRHPIAGPNPVEVTKHALCLPGDRLTTEEKPALLSGDALDGWYYCNGKLLAISLAHAHGGMRLDHMHFNGVVPPGMIYVGSSHPRGFDSRYLGLIPISRLTRMERVL